MKANRAARALAAQTAAGEGETAVSSVVSAVLLFALFTTVIVVWTVQTLPQWEADHEQVHQAAMSSSLSGLRSDLEGLAGRKDPGPATAVLQLGTPPVPLLQTAAAGGSLAVATGSEGLTTTVTFPNGAPMVWLTDGAATATPTRSTALPPCTGNCIQSLEALLVGFATSGVTGASTASVTLTATDMAAATVTATLTHAATGTTCTGQLRLVMGAQSQVLLCGVGATLATSADPYRVNLLDPVYGIGAALGRLQAPLSLTFTTAVTGTGAIQASTYAAVWLDSDGAEGVAGTGITTAAPIATQTGDRLVFQPLYQHYPQEALSFEGGAVIASQASTLQAVAADPSFALRVNTTTGVGSVRWTLVQLTGAGSVTGTKEATASVTFTSSQDLLLTTPATCSPCATFTLATPSATGWNHYFADRILVGSAATSAASGTGTTGLLSLSSGAGQAVTGGWHIHVKVIQAQLTVH